jgi:hypothetical protein
MLLLLVEAAVSVKYIQLIIQTRSLITHKGDNTAFSMGRYDSFRSCLSTFQGYLS